MLNIELWSEIRRIGWDSDHSDYACLRKELHERVTYHHIQEIAEFAKARATEMKEHLNEFAESQPEGLAKYWGVSDDSFWDLCCHIVGLGRDVYRLVMEEPTNAKRLAPRENFLYIFNNA